MFLYFSFSFEKGVPSPHLTKIRFGSVSQQFLLINSFGQIHFELQLDLWYWQHQCSPWQAAEATPLRIACSEPHTLSSPSTDCFSLCWRALRLRFERVSSFDCIEAFQSPIPMKPTFYFLRGLTASNEFFSICFASQIFVARNCQSYLDRPSYLQMFHSMCPAVVFQPPIEALSDEPSMAVLTMRDELPCSYLASQSLWTWAQLTVCVYYNCYVLHVPFSFLSFATV